MYSICFSSPIGDIRIDGTEEGVTGVSFCVDKFKESKNPPPELIKCKNELEEYFAGKRKEFSVKMIMSGTPFQKLVWEALLDIPYGETASYKDVSGKIGKPAAARAVGMANNRNKIAILIPCHRVIGSDGKLTGYAAGIWRKENLLRLENENSKG